MKNLFFKMRVLLKKEFQEELSYKFNFFLHIGSVLMFTTVFFFVAKAFGGAAAAAGPLHRYNGDYFSFVLIGLAMSGYMSSGLGEFSSAIRNEQMLGTLEVCLTTPTPLWVMLSAKLTWSFIYDSFHLGVYFVFGIFLLHAHYSGANLAVLPLIIALSLVAFNAIGMLSAGFILIFKRGDPLNAFIGFLSMLLGGVYYPVEVMPRALQTASAFLPITYTLRLMRDSLMRGDPFSALMPDFVKLFILCAALLPVSMWFFSYALRRAKKEGSLTHY